MVKKFSSVVSLTGALFLQLLLAVFNNTFIFLPHHTLKEPIEDEANEANATESKQVTYQHWLDFYEIQDPSRGDDYDESRYCTSDFKAVFYLGLAAGSVLAGLAAYLFDPSAVARSLDKSVAVFGLLLSAVHFGGEDGDGGFLLLWFLITAACMGNYLVKYIHTLESVPDHWRITVGLCGFGFVWSFSRALSLTLVVHLPNIHQALFWNSFAILVTMVLADWIVLPREEKVREKESLREMANGTFGLRYLVCLCAMWGFHGYYYYGLSHTWSDITEDPLRSKAFMYCFDAMSKVFGLAACKVWHQKRSVVAVLVTIIAVCGFVITAFGPESTLVVTTAGQTSSFLVSCSWNILWIISTESFGHGTRYLLVGLCSASARLSSMVGVLFTHHGLFHNRIPSLIISLLFLSGIVLVFLLPETEDRELVKKTKGSKANANNQLQLHDVTN